MAMGLPCITASHSGALALSGVDDGMYVSNWLIGWNFDFFNIFFLKKSDIPRLSQSNSKEWKESPKVKQNFSFFLKKKYIFNFIYLKYVYFHQRVLYYCLNVQWLMLQMVLVNGVNQILQ